MLLTKTAINGERESVDVVFEGLSKAAGGQDGFAEAVDDCHLRAGGCPTRRPVGNEAQMKHK